MNFSKIFIVTTILISLCSVSSIHAANVSYDGSAYMWPNSPGLGYGGLYIDDDISHTRLMSTLRGTGSVLCTGLDVAGCAGSTVDVYAILPSCTSEAQSDCVESLGARDSAGVLQSGTFSRYFPSAGLADFAGNAAAKVPAGGAPSIWTLPSASHNDGNEYMAIVSVKGYSTAARTELALPILHASIYPVAVKAGRYSRNVPSPNSNGVSHGSQDLMANCASIADGFCAARQDFPEGFTFALSVRLSTPPKSWLHGRIFSPTIKYESVGTSTRLSVEATPVKIAAVATWAPSTALPSSYRSSCTPTSNCGQMNPQSAGAHTAVEDWRALYGDKASWVRGHWMFMTLDNSTASLTNKCLDQPGVFNGFVTTNATGYEAGPPAYSSSTKSFTYKVASPHLDNAGVVIEGVYSMVVRSEVARCLYEAESGSITGEVAISYTDSGTKTAPPVVTASDDGTWMKISARGFHYSSPTITTKLIGGANVVPKATAAVPAAQVKSTPKLVVRKSLNVKSLAKYLQLSSASSTRYSVTVNKADASRCRVEGTSVVGIKKGKCRVTVTATTSNKKKTKGTVTLQVE